MREEAIKAIVQLIIVCTIVAASLEGFLRLQQIWGPLYDLEHVPLGIGYLPSNYLNHILDTNQSTQDFPVAYDRYRIRIDRNRPAPDTLHHPTRVLFLGDSFMAGLNVDEAHTIPHLIYETFMRKNPTRALAFYNAACPSYGIFNYIIQSRLLPRVVNADAVIIDIDETDLSDDYFGRDLIVRDFRDEVVAYRAYYKWDLLTRLNEQLSRTSLYAKRLLDRIITLHIILPALDDLYGRSVRIKDLDRWFLVSRKPETIARQEHPDAIDLFRRNIDELITVLKRELPNRKQIVIAMHAHLQHFKPFGGEIQWNRITAQVVEEVCRKRGVLFYDALPDLKKAFGERPEDFYVKNDMHFNADGLRVFAEGLASFLATHEVI